MAADQFYHALQVGWLPVNKPSTGFTTTMLILHQAGLRLHLRRVIAALFRQAVGDLLVAIQAAERQRSASEDVAFGAFERPLQIVVCLADRAGIPACVGYPRQVNDHAILSHGMRHPAAKQHLAAGKG